MHQKLNHLINQIQPIYQEMSESEIYKIQAENRTLGKDILETIAQILQKNPKDIDAVIWRIKLHNNWVFDDTSQMIADTEYIINTMDLEDKLLGYEWQMWIYHHKLAAADQVLAIATDYLIEISKLPQEKRHLSDEHFGKCFYYMAQVYRSKNETAEAITHYEKSPPQR